MLEKADFETDCVRIWNHTNTPLKDEDSLMRKKKKTSGETAKKEIYDT